MPWRDLVIMTPGVGRTSTNRSEGYSVFFRQLKRSCRRWQLKVLQLYLRGDLRLGMHSRFRNPRRSHVAPDRVCLIKFRVVYEKHNDLWLIYALTRPEII